MLLVGRSAIVYGAGGAVGGAVARAFAAEGARVFLAGRTPEPLEAFTANAGRGRYPNVGGFGVACAAIEDFCKQLAAEVGRDGVRVVCLRSAGSPDAPGVAAAHQAHATNAGISIADFQSTIAERTFLKRLPGLTEVASTAVLMASDRASAITGAIANVCCGDIVD